MYDFVFYDASTSQVKVTSKRGLDEGTYDLKLSASPLKIGVSKEMFFSVVMVNKCGRAKIIPQKIPSIFAFKQDPTFKAQHSFEFPDFTYDIWVQSKTDCGPVDYKLVRNGSTNQVPSFVTLKDK